MRTPTDLRHKLLARVLFVAAILTLCAVAWAAPEQANGDATEKPKAVRPRPGYPATFAAWIEPARTQPGKRVALKLEARLDEGWHIYSTTMRQDGTGPRKTVLSLTDTAGLKPLGDFQPDTNPAATYDAAVAMKTEYHEGKVVWTQVLEVPSASKPGQYVVQGTISHQLCNPKSCLPPKKLPFEAKLTVNAVGAAAPGNSGQATETAAMTNKGSEGATRKASQAQGPVRGEKFDVVRSQTEVGGLAAALGFGFLAGLILNVMPCVLPVVSIKIYGFVKQAGEGRRRVRLLGLAFGAGILFVFVVLAALAAFVGLGWGQQFQSDPFLVVLIALMVAFALGMFEVYTIGLPGFVNRVETATAGQEGVAGSFTKGMLATLLATPCSGPFLGATLSYALIQPPGVIFAVFSAVGLGMAFPYVLLSWNPNWLRIVPRPGEWMNTFKGVLGFLMLGSAAWLLWQRRANGELVVWTVVFCLFVAFGAWLYGRWSTPLASVAKQFAAPVVAAALIGLGAYFCFGLMYAATPVAHAGDRAAADTSLWQPFRRDKFRTLRAEGKTVIVDWTAEW
ncbi:MAG: hypothetical protein HYS12_05080 [Planctomycetes bacterium]|nr:hypothetical protein [Planctomycetota bacterium]